MSELIDFTSPLDRRLALGATGLLGAANAAGLLSAADVHVATRLGALGGEDDEAVLLAAALATRGVRLGSVCVDLEMAPQLAPALDWPEPAAWRAAVEASPLVAARVLRVDSDAVYLDRYWRDEVAVCADLRMRVALPAPALDEARLEAALARVFPGEEYAEQRDASRRAAGQGTSVLTGGPGTGKTTTVAGLLAVLAEQAQISPPSAAAGRGLRIGLTAPTGKAAARLAEATAQAAARLPAGDRDRLGPLGASTMHRLLGSRPGRRTRFRHDRGNRLPHDVVVVDEMSMVSLTMMARLLEALRPQARLVLVGDPDQLASVEAGAVLADLVAGLAAHEPSPVARLRARHRFGSGIGELADAVRAGDSDAVLRALRTGGEGVEFVEVSEEDGDGSRALLEATATTVRPRLVEGALALREAALTGDADTALGRLARHRLLCAHRRGPYGVGAWNRLVEQWISEATGAPLWEPMYEGRPLLVTANDYAAGLFNGDAGVVVHGALGHAGGQAGGHAGGHGGGHTGAVAVFEGAQGRLTLAAARLGEVETMHAMTVHKSQGSQADHVTMLLPPPESALLSRELFYTGLTRAQRAVTVVGTQGAVRAAVERRVQRATGLRRRLAPGAQQTPHPSSS